MAWQSWVVAVLTLGSYVVGLIAANTSPLGIANPWMTIVILPTLLAAFTLASNQLKPIGGPPPGTVVSKSTTEITQPADPNAPGGSTR